PDHIEHTKAVRVEDEEGGQVGAVLPGRALSVAAEATLLHREVAGPAQGMLAGAAAVVARGPVGEAGLDRLVPGVGHAGRDVVGRVRLPDRALLDRPAAVRVARSRRRDDRRA